MLRWGEKRINTLDLYRPFPLPTTPRRPIFIEYLVLPATVSRQGALIYNGGLRA